MIAGVDVDLPTPQHLHRFFEASLQRHTVGNATGIRFRDKFINYEEVNRRANLAARLIKRHLKDRFINYIYEHDVKLPTIAIDMQPCEDLIIFVLAILKMGAAYVPVDSTSPANRIKAILKAANPLCVLADEASHFNKDIWAAYFIVDTEVIMAEVKNMKVAMPTNLTDNERLLGVSHPIVAVIYTSGTAGKPKGVKLRHMNIQNRIHWQWLVMPSIPQEVACLKSSLLFVDSIIEIFSAIMNLIPLAICPKDTINDPEAFVSFLENEHISRVILVTSLLRNVLYYVSTSGGKSRLPALRLCMSNSEKLLPRLALQFFEIFPDSKCFANLYGSTETSADVSYEIFERRSDVDRQTLNERLSVGMPMFNTKMYIVDENLKLVSGDSIGEICVSGLSVSDGYLDDSKEQAACFLPNPFDLSKPHETLYRTGDYGCISRGRIYFDGRKDSQVKINGYRVNLAEIQEVLQTSDDVDMVEIVYYRRSGVAGLSGDLVAFYTCQKMVDADTSGSVVSKLIELCTMSLEDYMRPQLIKLEEFPMHAHSGKVDRGALERIYRRQYSKLGHLALKQTCDREQRLLNIFAANLNIASSDLPRDRSFWDLGGTSVSMIATIAMLLQYEFCTSISVFSAAKNIQELMDSVSDFNPVKPELLVNHDHYLIEKVQQVERRDQILDIFAESFVAKEPLNLLLGITEEEFLPFAKSIYRHALDENLSILAVDKRSKEVVGGCFLFDLAASLDAECHESMTPIIKFLEDFEAPVKKDLAEKLSGKLLYYFCLCVKVQLPPVAQVDICHLLVDGVTNVARDNGFIGIVAVNTNPALQDVCERMHGYETLAKQLVRDFEYNGQQVFGHAMEDYYVKIDIKYLKGGG